MSNFDILCQKITHLETRREYLKYSIHVCMFFVVLCGLFGCFFFTTAVLAFKAGIWAKFALHAVLTATHAFIVFINSIVWKSHRTELEMIDISLDKLRQELNESAIGKAA